MRFKQRPWLLSLGLLLCVPTVSATHTGALALGAGTLSAPINTETAVPIPKRHFAGGIRTEFTKFNSLSDAQLLRLKEEDPKADLHSTESLFSPSLLIAYGLSDNLSLGIRLPYVRRGKLREPEEEGVANLGSAAGIGDLLAFGQFRFLQLAQPNAHAALFLGFKAPSGVTDRRSRAGEKLEAELQPGSGSWDGLFGLAYTHNLAALTFNASTVYTVVTEGSQNTDLGDIFSYNAALSYRLPLGAGRIGEWFFLGAGGFGVDLILEFNGQWRDKTRISGHADKNSGGNVGYLSPGVRLLLGRYTNLGFSFGIPVVDNLNGDQDNLDFRLVGGLNFYF